VCAGQRHVRVTAHSATSTTPVAAAEAAASAGTATAAGTAEEFRKDVRNQFFWAQSLGVSRNWAHEQYQTQRNSSSSCHRGGA